MESASVLLVDDDSFILRLLEAVLLRRGITVVTADSGEAALAALREFTPELIIADVMMPGMSGYELCRRVRANGFDDVPFIFCSALGGLADRVSGLKAGADDYLTKPVDTEELVLRATSHLERVRQMRRLRQAPAAAAPEAAPGREVINGQIGGLGVADILQVAALLRQEPVVVTFAEGTPDEGRVWLQGSRLVHAQAGGETGRRAFLRLLGRVDGAFRVEEKSWTGAPTFDSELLDEAMLQGLAELDELAVLRQEVPGPRLVVQRRADAARRRLDEARAEVLSLLELEPQVEVVLARSPLREVETLRALALLAAEGFVVPV